MIIGVDKGTTFTKDSNYNNIKSTVKQVNSNDILIDQNTIQLTYKNTTYIIGENGNYETDLTKSKQANTLLLILAMLSQYEDRYLDTNIVTGLPIGLYSSQKEEMKNMIQGSHDIIINNRDKIINIRGCEIFPESAGAFYSQTEIRDALVIDVGGLSIDISLFKNRKLISYSTYKLGSMKLYSQIANYINSEYDLSLVEWDIEEILNNGLFLYGEKQDIYNPINEIITQFTQEIINRLKLEYDLKTINNIMLAGGCKIIHDKLRASFKHAKPMHKPQFANAIGYKNIGRLLFR